MGNGDSAAVALALRERLPVLAPDQLPSSVRILYSKTTWTRWPVSTDIWFIVARKGNELRLTGDEGEDPQPFSPRDPARVLHPPAAGGNEEIWSMDLDGNDERRILGSEVADYREPAVAPDDRRIAFTVVRGARSQVMVADVDGTSSRPLADGLASSQPAWSPDGTHPGGRGRGRWEERILLIPRWWSAGARCRPAATRPRRARLEPGRHPHRVRARQGQRGGDRGRDVAGGAVVRLTENGVEERSRRGADGERIAYVSRRPAAAPTSGSWIPTERTVRRSRATRTRKRSIRTGYEGWC